MTREISKLIEAINRVGIQNVSLLARMSGMPTETVRYTIKKRFPTMGLYIRTPINYAAMGLERYFVVMDMTPRAKKSAPGILDALSSTGFLTYWCRDAVSEHRYLTFFAIPVTLADEHRRFLNRLVEEGVLLGYRTERLSWYRLAELKSKYYDFAKGVWSVNWDEILTNGEAPPSTNGAPEPSSNPEIDGTDTLIIKELELDSWRNIAEIARKLNVNERTLRWHYGKHVAPIAPSAYVGWLPVARSEMEKAAGLVFEFSYVSTSKLKSLRFLFNNFPFTWFEAGRKDGYYQAQCGLPADSLMESLRFMNARLGEIVDSWVVTMIDLSSTQWFTSPYENFDNKRGWFFDEGAALAKILPQKLKIK